MPRPGQRTIPHWRSGSEEKTGEALARAGVPFGFETTKITYITPATKHTYTPDFVLDTGVFIEVKGIWTAADRQKIILVRKQTGSDIRMLFDRPTAPINKGSSTTYASFCHKHGIPWAKGPTPPAEWLQPKQETT